MPQTNDQTKQKKLGGMVATVDAPELELALRELVGAEDLERMRGFHLSAIFCSPYAAEPGG